MKFILSTGNIVSGGPSIIRKPGAFRSNLELTNSLRSAFLAAKQDYAPLPLDSDDYDDSDAAPTSLEPSASASASSVSDSTTATPLSAWTERDSTGSGTGIGFGLGFAGGSSSGTSSPYPPSATSETLYIPRIDWSSPESPALQEPRASYDITLKLFFLPLARVADRPAHAREALALVRRRLGLPATTATKTPTADLLILSFPGVSFEGDCEVEADRRNAQQGNIDEEVATWKALEGLQTSGEVAALGLAEFGSQKLARFLDAVSIKPAVDQINTRDCCNVPPALVELASKKDIELLVHSDCSDILPSGTLRELLGNGFRGAGVLADPAATSDGDAVPGAASTEGLKGNITPLWVIKYTAFVKDRGVVENKGYFAAAELDDA